MACFLTLWSHVITSIVPNNTYISFSENYFCFKNNCADPDEMQHFAEFHMGLHCFNEGICMQSTMVNSLIAREVATE